jgi:hypothetical protein
LFEFVHLLQIFELFKATNLIHNVLLQKVDHVCAIRNVQFFRKRGQQGVVGLDERSQLEIAHLEDVQYMHQLPDLLDANVVE